MAPTPTPVKLAVLGHPIAHSLSPLLHAAFGEATGLRVRYEAIDVPPGHLAERLAALAAAGYAGCNITLPHKAEALALANDATLRARLAGAANVLRMDARGIWADNTDGAGLVRDLQTRDAVRLAGARLLLLGAGGAAAGCLAPLMACAPASITLANRTLARAEALAARHAALAAQHGVALHAVPLAALDAPGESAAGGFDGVIHASSAGVRGEGMPFAPRLFAPGGFAVDLSYGPAAAPFVQAARAAGAKARDGLGMLVEQAAESFELWLGTRPPTEGALAQARAVLAQRAQQAAAAQVTGEQP